MAKRYRFSFKRMDVYRAAVEHFHWTCSVVERMPKGPFRVVNQAIGASLSVMGNIGEAHGRETKHGEIEQHYRYAQGSAFEAATHLDAFAALGVISDDEYNAGEERVARIGMMLTRLMQKQRRKSAERRRVAGRESQREREGAGKEDVDSRPRADGAARNGSTPREARPGGRSAAARFESRRVAEGAKRPPAIESSRSGAPPAAPAAAEFENRMREGMET